MREDANGRPDAAAMERLLAAHPCDAAGIVLRLAWRAGLKRGEIHSLAWAQTDLDAMLLRLPDREIPLDAETAEALRQWRSRCAGCGPYVAASEKNRRRMAARSLSNLARAALDEAGLEGVCLEDLRRDSLLRRPEAAPRRRDAAEAELLLWKLLQNAADTPEGLALWLSSQLGLGLGEIAALTWAQIDLDTGTLRLPDREVPLTAGTRRVLEAERSRRAPGDDPHVLLTVRSRKPPTPARLSALTGAALARGGLAGYTLRDFRRDAARADELARLADYAGSRGAISRREAAALLEVSEGAATRRLRALTEAGRLVRVGLKYYPPDRAASPEARREAVRSYAAAAGAVCRADVAALLRIDPRAAGRLLRRMADDGELILLRRSQRYALPEQEKGYTNETT